MLLVIGSERGLPCRLPILSSGLSTFSNRPICGRPASTLRSEIGRRGYKRIDGADQIVVEADQILSGIGLISNAGARFEAPETISAQGRFEDVHRGEDHPGQHLKDMELDGVAGEVLYPSQGLFYIKVADPSLCLLFSAGTMIGSPSFLARIPPGSRASR